MRKQAKNGSSRPVAELERPPAERNRVIGELTVANRGDLPPGRPFPACALFVTRRGNNRAGMLEGAACGPSNELITPDAASAGHRRRPRSPPTHHPPSAPPKNPAILTPDTWPPAPARGAPSDWPYPSRPTSSDQPSAISFQVATRTTKEFGLLVPVAVRPIGSLSDSTANLYSSVSICGFKSFGPHRTTPHVIHGFPGLPDAPGRFPESA